MLLSRRPEMFGSGMSVWRFMRGSRVTKRSARRYVRDWRVEEYVRLLSLGEEVELGARFLAACLAQ